MKITLLAAMFLAVVFISSAHAGKVSGNQPLQFQVTDLQYNAGLIEQQSDSYPNCDPAVQKCVYNNTGCLWTQDSNEVEQGFGYLTGGASATAQMCLIADQGTGHQFSVVVQASSPDLQVDASFQPEGVTWHAVAVAQPKGSTYPYKYAVCDNIGAGGVPLQPIPNSNGGVGVPSTVNVTVGNPTGRTQRDVFAWTRIENSFAC